MRREYFGGFFAPLRREKAPELGHVLDDAGAHVVLLPEKTLLDRQKELLRVLAPDDFGDHVQRIRQAAARDRVLVVRQTRVPPVRVLPETIGLRNGLQNRGEIEGAAAAVEIVRKVVIGVFELQISRFQIVADLNII